MRTPPHPHERLPSLLQGITSLQSRLRMRHKRGSFSERGMARIRAPTRADFLREVPVTPVTPDGEGCGRERERERGKGNERILDALDRLEEPGLCAIAEWLVSLREGGQLSDKDFTNGVALRHAMNIIDPTVGRAREELTSEAAHENLSAVREGLRRFGWGGKVGEDAWEMARWVVLAGVTGERCDDVLKGMMELDDGVQDTLSGVVKEVMEDAGIGDEDVVRGERERRVRAEREADGLREEVRVLKEECERLRRIVEGMGMGETDGETEAVKVLAERN